MRSMISRERILEAAARVYSKHGFRGATTRLIAAEAGVNEVTLFRTFGSKGALLEAVLEENDTGDDINPLPDPPRDPERELTEWVETHLVRIRNLRPLLIHAISEYEERPEVADFACRGRVDVHQHIAEYVARLHDRGLADRAADVAAAVTMLISSVMSDAMGRPMAPNTFPPSDQAAPRYVRCFLRMIGAPLSR
jgi:AcrR family transcriptional regulator